MKKKIILLLIPMLLLPMVSFAYAHYTDRVEKKYKVHVGSIFANLTYFHVDELKTVDADCDNVIWNDEFNVTIVEDPDTCTWYVLITCDPIPPAFELDTTLKIHNGGKLPWLADWEILYAGPFDEDYYGCFDGWLDADFTDLSNVPKNDPPVFGVEGWYFQNGLIYNINFWKEVGGVLMPAAPTQYVYHPCEELVVTQNVTLLQPPTPPFVDPNNVSSVDWQKNIQCKWFLIWIRISVINETPTIYDSATWENGTWTSQGNIPG